MEEARRDVAWYCTVEFSNFRDETFLNNIAISKTADRIDNVELKRGKSSEREKSEE